MPAQAPTELRAYQGRGFVAGWRVDVQFADGTRRLDILVDDWFPRSAPRMALVDRPDFLTWPHVERDGVLCLLPGTAAVDPDRSCGCSSRHVLGSACQLVEECIAGTNADDFRQEFLSYWDWAVPEQSTSFYSLLNPAPPTRAIRLWNGKTFALLGDSDADIPNWLANRRGERARRQRHDVWGSFSGWTPRCACASTRAAAADLLELVAARRWNRDLSSRLAEGEPESDRRRARAPRPRTAHALPRSPLPTPASTSPKGRNRRNPLSQPDSARQDAHRDPYVEVRQRQPKS